MLRGFFIKNLPRRGLFNGILFSNLSYGIFLELLLFLLLYYKQECNSPPHMIDPFYITIRHDGRAYKLKVVQVLNDCTHEQFDLIGRNRKVTIQSNRPYLRRLGLKHKRPNWVVIEGQVLLPGLLQNYIDELMQIIDK